MDQDDLARKSLVPVYSAPHEAEDLESSSERKGPFPPRLIATGLALLAVCVGSFATWSMLAPIEGAVIAPGIVSVASYRKQVQHLEGGIVEDILVRDGDHVTEGQLLVRLRDVKPAAELRQWEWQHIEAHAIIARLLAEQQDSEEIQFPEELLAQSEDPSVSSVMASQRGILASRQSLARDRLSLLEHKIAQAGEEIKGLEGQILAKKEQRGYIRQQLATMEKAYASSLVPEAQVLTLRQRLSENDGALSGYRADIARIEQAVVQMRLQISEERAALIAETTEQLRVQRARLFDLSQKIISARDVLSRTKVVAPIDGVVVNLQVHTKDGVIAAGQPLLEVVPTEDDLVIYAFVDPEDIDEVRVGMPADVRLTSLSRRERVPLEGIVSGLSADRLTDPETGRDYYRAQIRLVMGVTDLGQSPLVAGMGADVFIRTGARTFLDYVLSPITRSLQLGLREK